MNENFCFFLLFINYFLIISPIKFSPNDYEPRVFDYIPSNCYDCLTSRDIILTQLINVPARAFANFNLGSYDTNMILNGQVSLTFQPYAFQSLVIQKPNKTLTLTFSAPNSWLNITEKTFHGLDLRSYSTLRVIIKFFYGCTFHPHSLSGIQMGPSSRLILDISSVTQIHFHSNLFEATDQLSSIDFLISRSETILFDRYSFSSLGIPANEVLSFQFELVSHIHFKSYSFQSIELQKSSRLEFYSIYLNRLTIDSYAFENLSFDDQSIFNLTIQSLGSCLCFKSHTFNNFHEKPSTNENQIVLTLNTLRGLSFFPYAFANISLKKSQLKISSDNPSNDPNPIINFASKSLAIENQQMIVFNLSTTAVVHFERDSIQANSYPHQISFQDVTLIDFSALNVTSIQLNFSRVQYIKWFQNKKNIQLNFNQMSNKSCAIYQAPRTLPWLFSSSSICNCPLLFAYKLGQLDGQNIPCLRALSGHETARLMDQCQFEHKERHCQSIIQTLTDLKSNGSISVEIDHYFIRQLYDKNYLTCSVNYSFYSSSSSLISRSRLFNNIGLVVGIILAIFVILSILVMALLNGLQYKMREYDETWTWRRNMSWTSLRRTISQTSLRRSRRDLRTINGNVVTSKSENQLDRLRREQGDSDDQEGENENVKRN